MTLSYTKNLHLAVPDFLTEPWHGEFAAAMDSIDQILYQTIILQQAALWQNSHVYTIGTVVISPDTGLLYTCAVPNTSSPSPTTFTQELVAHPTFWTVFSPTLASQAEAEAGVENTKYMSPLRVKQSIAVNAPAASIASQPQAEAGTDNTQMMTPLRVAQSVAVRVIAEPPQCRITLGSGTPVMTGTLSAKTKMYYTPFRGAYYPRYDGSKYVATKIPAELVADLTDTAKNPAAIGASKVNDWFVWEDTNTITMTIASPGVISWTGHGMAADHPFILSTDGALPTGVVAGTVYFVLSSGLTANSFQFSASKGGSAINTTGSQSGTHTATVERLTHGPDWTNDTTRSAGTALTVVDGFSLNSLAITNGPIASRGLWVGTTRSNGSSQLDWVIGGNGVAAVHNVWNAYNRVPVPVFLQYTAAASYTYASTTPRETNGVSTMELRLVRGADEDGLALHSNQVGTGTSGSLGVIIGFGLDNSAAFHSASGAGYGENTNAGGSMYANWAGFPGIGYHVFYAVEKCTSNVSGTFYGSGASGTGRVVVGVIQA